MFCFQCQETAKNQGCTVKGVCGKPEETANLQDLLIHVLKGTGIYGEKAVELGFSKADQIKQDEELFSLHDQERFRKVVASAAAAKKGPRQGWQYQVRPAVIENGVATVDEGCQLRDAGIELPILVFGGVDGVADARDAAEQRLGVVVHHSGHVEALAAAGGSVPVTVEIDTGMHRMGVPLAEAQALKA